MTVKASDGPNHNSSLLNRSEVFRLNFTASPHTFMRKFGEAPGRPAADSTVDMPYDFSALDTLLSNPVYAWMRWMCILNSIKKQFERIKPLLAEAYQLAASKYQKKHTKQ